MKLKPYIIVSFVLTLCLGGVTVFFFENGRYLLTILFLIVTLYLCYHTLKILSKLFRDIDDFAEAVRYRDFSKRYPEAVSQRNIFYKHFNAISETFLDMGRDKEVQHQYLKRILEVVNTGIIAYDTDTLDTLWMNDAFNTMFKIPHVKNINRLRKRYPILYQALRDMPLGENRITTINTGHQTIKTLCNACTFQTAGKTYLLIAFHNISATLEEIESGAWKGLLNVMTHEIMNSIAPVASLADTLKQRMERIKGDMELKGYAEFEDVESAMETIRRRSEGLLRFADAYRNLTKNIVPDIQPVNLSEWLKSIYRLMQPSLEQKGIRLSVKTDNPSVTVNMDRSLIEHVIINFITNASHAVKDKDDPAIFLYSGSTDGNSYFTVADNGCGISPEIREKIFIPFFSTKKNGTGIGLTLSREIIKLHNGSLQLQTKEGEGSAFTVFFKQKSNF